MGVKIPYTFTRPANTTAYTTGDLVANNITAGSVVPMSFVIPVAGSLRRLVMTSTKTSIVNANFRVWLLSSSPTVTNGDNGAIAGVALATVLGVVPVNLETLMTGAGTHGVSTYDPGLIPLGATVYGLIEALNTYTPASGEVFVVTVEVE